MSDIAAEITALLAEWQYPDADAHDLARSLADWHGREPLNQDALDAGLATAEAELRREWGSAFGARRRNAINVASDAMARLPWLRELLEGGAGNDPYVVKHFAAIRPKNVRRAERKRRNIRNHPRGI